MTLSWIFAAINAVAAYFTRVPIVSNEIMEGRGGDQNLYNFKYSSFVENQACAYNGARWLISSFHCYTFFIDELHHRLDPLRSIFPYTAAPFRTEDSNRNKLCVRTNVIRVKFLFRSARCSNNYHRRIINNNTVWKSKLF